MDTKSNTQNKKQRNSNTIKDSDSQRGGNHNNNNNYNNNDNDNNSKKYNNTDKNEKSDYSEEEDTEMNKIKSKDDDDDDDYGDEKCDNNKDDKGDDDLSMFEDDDEDGVDGELYGQKRNRPDFSTGAPPGSFEMYALNRLELEERRNRHHEVVRKILAEFDLEEVMERYRGKGVLQDLSHTNRKFRMWLEKVMGSESIQMSDRRWHELLRQKVMEDYEHKQNERERQLAEAEVQRIQRLRLQGILTSDDKAANGHGHAHKRSKRKSPSTDSNHSSRQQGLYAKPTDDIQTQMSIINITDDDTREDRTSTTQDVETAENKQVEEEEEDRTTKANNGQRNSKSDNAKTKTREGKSKTKVVQINEPEPEDSGIHEESADDDNTNNYHDNNNGHIGMCGDARLSKNQNVQCLYKEEDLHQLYAQAEMLVRAGNCTTLK